MLVKYKKAFFNIFTKKAFFNIFILITDCSMDKNG